MIAFNDQHGPERPSPEDERPQPTSPKAAVPNPPMNPLEPDQQSVNTIYDAGKSSVWDDGGFKLKMLDPVMMSVNMIYDPTGKVG